MKTLTFIFFLLFVCMCGADNLLTVQDGTEVETITGGSWVGEATSDLSMNTNDILGVKKLSSSNIVSSIATITNTVVGSITLSTGNNISVGLSSNVEYHFTSAMSLAQIQAIVSSVPRNLNSFSVAFWFDAGTYIWDTLPLYVEGFYGSGTMYITGPFGFYGLDTNQTAIINNTNQAAFVVRYNKSPINIQYLNMRGVPMAAYVQHNMNLQFTEMYVRSNGSGQGFQMEYSRVYIRNSVFDNCGTAISAGYLSKIVCNNNSWTNTRSAAGHAVNNSLIFRLDAKQVGTADNNLWQGGQISLSSGAWY